jgi:CheY-like chemotaxis protein
VLIVEDEMLIAAQMEEALADLGCTTCSALRLEEALSLVASSRFDAAFLDLDLKGKPSLPVADALSLQGIPFAFMTGYQSPRVKTRYPHAPVLPKPFKEGDIAQTLAILL